MTNLEFDKIMNIITEKTGIIPRESHKVGIQKYIEKRTEVISVPEFILKIQNDKSELEELVNGSTVNETYFFREEKQFALLQKKIFTDWVSKNGNQTIKVWSAACSDGAEPYSIALLAQFCRIKVEITASDINTDVLERCKKGVFKTSSVRMGDGEYYKDLLSPYKTSDGDIIFPDSIKAMLQTVKINLAELDTPLSLLTKKQDIIFVRNVFIYFSREMRAKILKTLADKYLAENGIIFVSMNEVAQIDNEIMPSSLEKVFDGNVFYFRKR